MESIGGENTEMPTSIRKVVVASFIGTTIEWYDYFMFVTAASMIFPDVFFPGFGEGPRRRSSPPSSTRRGYSPDLHLHRRRLRDERRVLRPGGRDLPQGHLRGGARGTATGRPAGMNP